MAAADVVPAEVVSGPGVSEGLTVAPGWELEAASARESGRDDAADSRRPRGCDGWSLPRILVAFGLSLCLQGCAMAASAVGGAAAFVGIDAIVERTLNAIVYQTFTASVDDVRRAALDTLGRMGMPMTADERTDAGWALAATAADRTVEIELERLTSTATSMRVAVNEGETFFKDKATAWAIAQQTAQRLLDEIKAKGAPSDKGGGPRP